jgi:hypothetical protein
VGEKCYTDADVDALANGALTTVVRAIACDTNHLFDDHCIGKHWMSKFPGGAVAHYAATMVSTPYSNNILSARLFQNVWDKGITNQAHATTEAEDYTATDNPPVLVTPRCTRCSATRTCRSGGRFRIGERAATPRVNLRPAT